MGDPAQAGAPAAGEGRRAHEIIGRIAGGTRRPRIRRKSQVLKAQCIKAPRPTLSSLRRNNLEVRTMSTQDNSDLPSNSLSFLKHEDGRWNLLPILAGVLGLVFVAYLFF
jgi:hypothetical protein